MLAGSPVDWEARMEFVGDLERAFASAIYPNRLVVAIAGVVLIALIGLRARQRRWDSVARRHPRRTLAAAAITVAIVGPLGWYLGSPLLVSRTIDEPAPVVAADPTLVPSHEPSSAPATSAPTAAPSVLATPSAPPPAPERIGSFTGADDFHFGEGTARLIETAPGQFTLRLEDFAVRNGPDLFVYLSSDADGYAEGAVELGRLKADRGNQNYEVPAGTNLSSVRSVVIWCRQFSVLFATAELSS